MALNSKRVLVVDDDEDLLRLMSLALTADGYDVTTARDGREAIRCVRENIPDLLILDLMIPFINGYHVAHEILYDKTLAKKPKILIITGRDIKEETKLIEFIGASRILEKPFTNEELKKTVAELVS